MPLDQMPSMPVSSPLAKLPKIDQHSENLAEAVYDALMDAILAGDLPPGSILSALKLSGHLNVSRTPVQQALTFLAADGLVENESGRRAKVAHFTRDDLYNIFAMRRLLESHAAELAAGRMDERHFAPLRQTAMELKDEPLNKAWQEKWTAFDEDFHRIIAECSGNPLLAKDIGRYRLLHRGVNRITANVESLPTALEEHFEILSALENRDGASARTAMDAHIAKWQIIFTQQWPAGN